MHSFGRLPHAAAWRHEESKDGFEVVFFAQGEDGIRIAGETTAVEEGGHDGFVAADAAFHRAVVLASANPLLLRLHDAVAAVLAQSIGDTADDAAVGAAHRALLEAIRSGDAERAAAAPYALVASVKAAAARR